MTLANVTEKVRSFVSSADVSGMDFLGVQINMPGTGAIFVEVKDGKTRVDTGEYPDRNCTVTISADDFMQIIDGTLDPVLAYTMGMIEVSGEKKKALEFVKLLLSK